MGKFGIKHIRTLALVGQAGSGKTTLAEALLAQAGAIPAMGSVQRGTTVCDYTGAEKVLGHSLKLAVASFAASRLHRRRRGDIRIGEDRTIGVMALPDMTPEPCIFRGKSGAGTNHRA